MVTALVIFCLTQTENGNMEPVINPEETWLIRSYGALLKENARLQIALSSKHASNTQVECFKTKLRKEKLLNKWLNEEVHVQAKVISQLEALLKDVKTMKNTRTRFLCELGHKWCKIDHSMYNYVSRSTPDKIRSSRSQFSRSVKMESLGPRNYLGNISLATMSKKIDQLQSRYGVPPVSRQNVSEDLIHPVFTSIWENVLSFKHKMLDTAGNTFKTKTSKPKKMAFKFKSSVIMES